jgi:BirA family biotin operon repressor/biotin-[acetyl-CoA-carboxylase] ligase
MKIGSRIIKLSSVDSTNNYAAKLLEEQKVGEGTAILASFQEEGRGQRGAKWQSAPYENLLCSIIVFPHFLRVDNHFLLSKAVALAIVDLLNGLGIKDVTIKWPNDILVSRKKIAGILIENAIRGFQLESSIIGIGLNVNPSNLPTEHSTSLFHLRGVPRSIDDVAMRLFECLNKRYAQLQSDQSGISSDYWKHLHAVLQQETFLIDGVEVEAKITGLRNDGRLTLSDDTREWGPFHFGQIRWVQA